MLAGACFSLRLLDSRRTRTSRRPLPLAAHSAGSAAHFCGKRQGRMQSVMAGTCFLQLTLRPLTRVQRIPGMPINASPTYSFQLQQIGDVQAVFLNFCLVPRIGFPHAGSKIRASVEQVWSLLPLVLWLSQVSFVESPGSFPEPIPQWEPSEVPLYV